MTGHYIPKAQIAGEDFIRFIAIAGFVKPMPVCLSFSLLLAEFGILSTLQEEWLQFV